MPLPLELPYGQKQGGRGEETILWDAAFLLTIGSFLLTIELLRLQLLLGAILLT